MRQTSECVFCKNPFVLCWLLRALFTSRKEGKKRVGMTNDPSYVVPGKKKFPLVVGGVMMHRF
jgi:hypothetical protein